jgi:CubicO group peptidase (beta-lactamase class C family)
MSIAVVRGRDTIVMKGYGMADVENEVPATAQTVYRIGSVTKQFTSVALMQLVQQGKLSLDDEITKYVPNAPVHGRKILVRHLMNHTSGIPSYTDVGPIFGRVMRQDLAHDSLLAVVRDDSLQFEPGSHFYYNNTGYYLLGMIIEKVTGKKYGEYVQEALFTPNGLTSTVYCSESPLIKHRARGYDASPTGLTNTDYISMDLPYAAGSLCSTVGSHRRIHHGGGINGFISELAHYPDDSLTIVVLANTSPAPSNQVADNLARIAFGMPIPAPTPPADLPIGADERTRLVGNYRVTWPDGSKRPARVYLDSDRLMMQIDGQPAAGARLLKQAAPNTFAVQGLGRIVFDITNGKATGFFIDAGARPREAVRVP